MVSNWVFDQVRNFKGHSYTSLPFLTDSLEGTKNAVVACRNQSGTKFETGAFRMQWRNIRHSIITDLSLICLQLRTWNFKLASYSSYAQSNRLTNQFVISMLCRARRKQLCLNLIMQSDEVIFNTSVKCTVVTYELGSSTPRRTAGPSFFIQKTIDSIIYPDMLKQFALPHVDGKTAYNLSPTGQRYTSF